MSGTLDIGIRNTAQGIWNLSNEWNMTENPECSSRNSDSEAVESRMQDCFGFSYFIWGTSNVSLQTSYSGEPFNTNSPPTERTLGPAAVCLVSLGNLSTRRSWFTNGMAGCAELDRGRSLRAKRKSLSKPTWNHHECRHNNSVENAFQRFYYDLKVLTKQKNIQGLKTVILDIKC